MKVTAVILVSCIAFAAGQVNFNPVTITVNGPPTTILATPITPSLPYSQAAYQCNVTGDTRYPPYATGTFPLNVSVPVGTLVRIVFANGNLGGTTVTQQGQAGVIVQQGGAVIVQQAGGASPIVQNPSSPIVQQNAAPAALVVQQSPTVVQPGAPSSPVVQPVASAPRPPPPPATSTPATPAPTTRPASPPPPPPAPTSAATTTAPTSTPTPSRTTAAPTPTTTSTATTTATPTATATVTPTPTATGTTTPTPTSTGTTTPTPTATTTDKPNPTSISGRRMILQNTVPGGPNNGLVEYVGLRSNNTVSGFVVPNTQFGVPYVEFTATAANVGQVASFMGSLVVANVVGGVPQIPFVVNPSLSPFCQVNVNFRAVAASG